MGRIIALINQKGGVAKSTTAHALGAGLAHRGYKVLLIDFDAQANLTAIVKAESTADISEVIEGKCTINQAITAPEGASNLDIVLSAPRLALISDKLKDSTRLNSILEPVKKSYDYIVIDCGPQLTALTINALTTADYAIIPAQADIFSLQAIASIVSTVEAVKRTGNSKLKIAGVLLTMYDKRPVLVKEATEAIENRAKQLGIKVFNTRIRNNVALIEAQALHKDIYTHKPKSNGAIDYNSFVAELLETINK